VLLLVRLSRKCTAAQVRLFRSKHSDVVCIADSALFVWAFIMLRLAMLFCLHHITVRSIFHRFRLLQQCCGPCYRYMS
jgi:hypothetical protein